jgi:hypothetical protein
MLEEDQDLKPPSRKRGLLSVLLFILVLGVALGGFYYYDTKYRKPKQAGDAIESCSNIEDCGVENAMLLALTSCTEGEGRGCRLLYLHYFDRFAESGDLTSDDALIDINWAVFYAKKGCREGAIGACQLHMSAQRLRDLALRRRSENSR